MSFVPSREFFLEVAKGAIGGHTLVERSGFHTSLGSGLADVTCTNAAFNWPTNAQSCEILSSSANDTSVGSGARTVLISGIDGSYNLVNETKTMNGTTAVALTNSYRHITQVEPATSGSGETNAGNIDVQVASGGNILARCATGEGKAGHAAYFVPGGKTAYLVGWTASLIGGTDGLVEAAIRVMEDGKAWRFPWKAMIATGSNTMSRGITAGHILVLPEKTRIIVQAKSTPTGLGIASSLQLILI